jgi:hypothetical protein
MLCSLLSNLDIDPVFATSFAKVHKMTFSVQLHCVANHEPTLARNLQMSPEVDGGLVSLSVIWGASAASAAYHDTIRDSETDILVFAHQDVYFPDGWFAQVKTVCAQLSSIDPSWAVAGVFGVASDGKFVGHVWDSALALVCGGSFDTPQEVLSLDEVVLIVRRASGISFDPTLPSFHLYGTDIVLEARKAGFKSYAIDLPVVHNSKPVVRLDRSYVHAYHFMVAKWSALLPWPTVILQLTRNPAPLLLRRIRLRYRAIFRRSVLYPMLENPERKAQELGFVRESANVGPCLSTDVRVEVS